MDKVLFEVAIVTPILELVPAEAGEPGDEVPPVYERTGETLRRRYSTFESTAVSCAREEIAAGNEATVYECEPYEVPPRMEMLLRALDGDLPRPVRVSLIFGRLPVASVLE